mgnify:CR=1 FL=1
MEERLLEVKNLKVSFNVGKTKLTAVENVEFSLDKGKVIGIVGESGCGKSVTATSILRLVPPAVSIIDESSQILFDGEDLVKAPEARMREIRGNEISMIFQEPMSSLNPVYRIGDQMLEMIRTHNKQISKKDALDQCVEMLKRVGIPSPEQRIKEFPHQLSGGMRQRVMIAMALLCNPKLLIADEPTTALDVTIQAQILRIIKTLTKESNTSVILITHDMGVVAEVGENWATVRTLVDSDTEMGGQLARTGGAAILEGDFALMGEGRLKLTYLPENSELIAGDLVTTSGRGGVYPAGLVAGHVEEVRTDASGMTRYAVIAPETDLDGLQQVFVITDFTVNE